MTLKRTRLRAAGPQRAPTRRLNLTLTCDEHARVTAFVTLLLTINKRVNGKKGKTKTAKDKIKKSKYNFSMIWNLYLLITDLSLSTCNSCLMDIQHMIDTIVLLLNKDYHISNPVLFTPSAQWADGCWAPGMQSKQNPTQKELKSGIYKPRLTLHGRINLFGKKELTLKIEVSLPKLLFGNNFDELKGKDFGALTKKLSESLQAMGVIISPLALAKAPISAIHYSKNIALTDGSTPYQYINKIKEANVKLSLDVNQTDYRNDGHSYKWHCNSYEVVFYDKIADLGQARQTSKRAIERDSALQLSLLDHFDGLGKLTIGKRTKLEILRMEVRLNKRKKIKHLLKKLNIASNLTFKGLFKPAISKKILLHYLDELESKRPALLDYRPSNDKGLLAALIINNPDLGPRQILQLYGLKKSLEIVTTRELRGMFSQFNQRGWYRLIADVKKVNLPAMSSPFSAIREQIMKFKPLKM